MPVVAFVVTWSSVGQDGDTAVERNVYARRFDASGNALSGEFLVNTTTAGDQTNPSIAMDRDGDFVIVWEGAGPDDVTGIYGQRYDSGGTPRGGQFFVNDLIPLGIQLDPAVSMDEAGNFVVVWDDFGGFHARRYDNTGSPQGSQFSVTTLPTAGNGTVSLDADGDFVVAWRQDTGDREVLARQYSANGAPLGAEFLVNTSSPGTQTDPTVDVDAAGNFIVVWEGNGIQAGEADNDGVFGQRYDAAGAPVGGEFRINQTTTNSQTRTSVAMLDLDNYVVVWSGEGPGDTDGVFVRQFGTGLTADAGGPYTIDEGEDLVLLGSASNDPTTDPVTFAWDLNNDLVYGDVVTASPTVAWSTLQSFGIDDDGVYPIGLQATDALGGTGTATATVTVDNVAPILSTSGATTTSAGALYTLNLSSIDPGADTISSWTIDWGDGTVETFNTNPTSVDHAYTTPGITYNIQAAATDDDGTYLLQELLVPSYNGNSVFRFEENTGAFLQEFAGADGIDDPIEIILGPDGNLYLSGDNSGDVLRYNADDGSLRRHLHSQGDGRVAAGGGTGVRSRWQPLCCGLSRPASHAIRCRDGRLYRRFCHQCQWRARPAL